jgi:hypothetical protein
MAREAAAIVPAGCDNRTPEACHPQDFYKTIAEQGAALREARGGVIAKKQQLWPLQAGIVSEEPLEVCQSIPQCLLLGAECFRE